MPLDCESPFLKNVDRRGHVVTDCFGFWACRPSTPFSISDYKATKTTKYETKGSPNETSTMVHFCSFSFGRLAIGGMR